MRSRQLLSLAILAVPMLACIEPLELPKGRFGLVTVETFGPDDPIYTVAPSATFFGETNIELSIFPVGTCAVGPWADIPLFGGSFKTLFAGDELAVTVSGQARQLVPDTAGTFISYIYGSAAGLPHTPGDTMTIVIPGGGVSGFPASNLSVRTAEPFTHSDVPWDIATTDDINITWDAAPAPGSIMSFALAYPNEFGSPFVRNEQVLCAFDDDGTGTIPAFYLNGWRTVLQDTTRRVVATRLRYQQVIVDARTKVAVVSLFRRPLPTFTP